MSKRLKHCVLCGKQFEAVRASHRYCSTYCSNKAGKRKRKEPMTENGRYCRQCGVHFVPQSGKGGNNQLHCSLECSRKSARESRSKFYARNPEKIQEYRRKTVQKHGHKSNVDRFLKRYPYIKKACQSCGEDRVLDIAHKPEHKRNGAWRSASNTTPEKVWILCPTCHALLDRLNYAPKSLGLE